MDAMDRGTLLLAVPVALAGDHPRSDRARALSARSGLGSAAWTQRVAADRALE